MTKKLFSLPLALGLALLAIQPASADVVLALTDYSTNTPDFFYGFKGGGTANLANIAAGNAIKTTTAGEGVLTWDTSKIDAALPDPTSFGLSGYTVDHLDIAVPATVNNLDEILISMDVRTQGLAVTSGVSARLNVLFYDGPLGANLVARYALNGFFVGDTQSTVSGLLSEFTAVSGTLADVKTADRFRIGLDLRNKDQIGYGTGRVLAMDNASVTQITAVPEPATLSLAGLGMVAMLIRRRRRS